MNKLINASILRGPHGVTILNSFHQSNITSPWLISKPLFGLRQTCLQVTKIQIEKQGKSDYF